MQFYVGTHMVNHAKNLSFCMISVNRLIKRKSDFLANTWILDSGAFTRITQYGEHWPIDQYVDNIHRWSRCGNMVAAVTQDWMCEPFALEKTGLTVDDHQDLTVERYARLSEMVHGSYIMPVLQGYTPDEYRNCIAKYGPLLRHGQWVGVGSVCKRNADTRETKYVLHAIKTMRPDLRLHGFGMKLTALADTWIREMLYSADSMAWSFSARKQGKDSYGVKTAMVFAEKINNMPMQRLLTDSIG